jgi:hypothetical protein
MSSSWSKESSLWLFTEWKEANLEIRRLDETHERERSGFLWEIIESWLARRAPWLSKFLDVSSSIWLSKKDPEVVSRQNELEWFTAWSIFIPDRFLRIITDPIVKIPWFAALVKAYPLGNSIEKKLLDWDGNIKDNYDPDDVISFIRMVHQDFISGKVGIDKIS